MSGYKLHPEAFADIDEIAAYIGQDSPEAAHRVVTRSTAPFKAWFLSRYRGRRRSDLTSRPLRFWVVAVIHGYRSPHVMAAILKDRED
jgi:plasmid stabilization system protein ParE